MRGIMPYENNRRYSRALHAITGCRASRWRMCWAKPMIYWVYQAAKACPKLDDVLIATDDRRIADGLQSLRYALLDDQP